MRPLVASASNKKPQQIRIKSQLQYSLKTSFNIKPAVHLYFNWVQWLLRVAFVDEDIIVVIIEPLATLPPTTFAFARDLRGTKSLHRKPHKYVQVFVRPLPKKAASAFA